MHYLFTRYKIVALELFKKQFVHLRASIILKIINPYQYILYDQTLENYKNITEESDMLGPFLVDRNIKLEFSWISHSSAINLILPIVLAQNHHVCFSLFGTSNRS